MTELADLRATQQDGFVLMSVRGEIDFSNADQLAEEISQHLDANPNGILDLTPTTYLDSSGINMLFLLHRSLAGKAATLRIVSDPTSNVHRVLEVCGMVETLQVAPSIQSAMESESN